MKSSSIRHVIYNVHGDGLAMPATCSTISASKNVAWWALVVSVLVTSIIALVMWIMGIDNDAYMIVLFSMGVLNVVFYVYDRRCKKRVSR